MKTIKQIINEAASNVSSSISSNDLIIQINLSKLDIDTLNALYNDSSIDWSKLKEKDLIKLYDLLDSDLSFDEWKEVNEF